MGVLFGLNTPEYGVGGVSRSRGQFLITIAVIAGSSTNVRIWRVSSAPIMSWACSLRENKYPWWIQNPAESGLTPFAMRWR